MTRADKIEQWMTRAPYTVSRGDSVEYAGELLRTHGFRHLPVVDHGKLVGLVSERDLFVVARFTNTHGIQVETVMALDPYIVPSSASLVEVAAKMQGTRHDAAVIVDDGLVVGVFTSDDALRALAAG